MDKNRLLLSEITALRIRYLKERDSRLLDRIAEISISLYTKDMIQLIRGKGHAKIDAEGISQESALAFWRALHKRHNTIDNLRSFMLGIARNKAIDAWKNKRDFLNIADLQLEAPSAKLPGKKLAEIIDFCSRYLEGLEKKVFQLRMQGHSHAKIAEKLSITEKHSSALYNKLKERLEVKENEIRNWLMKD